MYGNVRLLWRELVSIEQVAGPPDHAPDELDEIEHITEKHVLEGKVLICGIHNEAHRRAALVPLRWGAPRIIVLSGGFRFHLGEDLEEEPFRAARLWRYQWDKDSDLAISRRAPSKLPTYARHNPTVDRMVSRIAANDWLGLRWIEKSVLRILA
jgi:DNA processing protein